MPHSHRDMKAFALAVEAVANRGRSPRPSAVDRVWELRKVSLCHSRSTRRLRTYEVLREAPASVARLRLHVASLKRRFAVLCGELDVEPVAKGDILGFAVKRGGEMVVP